VPPEDVVPLDALPFPAAMLDSQAAIISANAEWVQAYPGCLPGRPFQAWCETVHATAPRLSAALLDGAWRALQQGERFVQNYGEGERFRITITLCHSAALVVHQDLYPAPERMRAQKMETMGRLMAGVAHDFANLITVIDGYCDILLQRAAVTDPLHAELQEVRNAVGHGARLTSQLLDFTRGHAAVPAALDLNHLVREMNRMLRPIIGEQINLEITLAEQLDQVVADPGQMEQVIVNLILNARDAMPSGGTIRVATANTETGVTLSVADTGSGIDTSVLPHVFEPFFTTKENGRGTGLGLSTVKEIVEQGGGEIRVQSHPGRGTTFTIRLPRVRRMETAGRTAESEEPQTGHETVLLVEDEESVRGLLAHMLHNRGYRVLQAASGAEALPVFETHAAEIDLVLTDIVMPGMSGLELAGRLRRMRPETPIVFMSGYSGDVLTRTGPLPEGMSFLPKPLRPDVLVAKLREALDRSSRPFNPR
jgi:two-component system cell cycle sensor histidine kinase/response regulator CckA